MLERLRSLRRLLHLGPNETVPEEIATIFAAQGIRVIAESEGRQASTREVDPAADGIIVPLEGWAKIPDLSERNVPIFFYSVAQTGKEWIAMPIPLAELADGGWTDLIRRGMPPFEILEFSGVRLSPGRYECSVDNEVKKLTGTEFRLLEVFLRNPDRVFRRQELIRAVMGPNEVILERTIDVHVKTLRKKLKRPGLIETVRSAGYRFATTRPADPVPVVDSGGDGDESLGRSDLAVGPIAKGEPDASRSESDIVVDPHGAVEEDASATPSQ